MLQAWIMGSFVGVINSEDTVDTVDFFRPCGLFVDIVDTEDLWTLLTFLTLSALLIFAATGHQGYPRVPTGCKAVDP